MAVAQRNRHCVIAYIGEGDAYEPVLEAAIDAAHGTGARLILYDADAAGRFGAPLPTWWSGEGAGELFDDPLTVDQLEAAGRGEIARRVREARMAGIDAGGWLPSSRGAHELAEYAGKHGADLLIVPADFEEIGLLDRVRGQPTVGEIAAETKLPVRMVPLGEHAAGVQR